MLAPSYGLLSIISSLSYCALLCECSRLKGSCWRLICEPSNIRILSCVIFHAGLVLKKSVDGDLCVKPLLFSNLSSVTIHVSIVL